MVVYIRCTIQVGSKENYEIQHIEKFTTRKTQGFIEEQSQQAQRKYSSYLEIS
jgi:hypothetical protein